MTKPNERATSLRIPDTPIVSFDVFDTLIARTTATPKQVFACIEQSAITSGYHEAAGFATLRALAETSAIHAVGSASLRLSDIYKELAYSFPSELLSVLQEKEIDAEVSLCRPIPQVVDLLKRSQESGKNTVLTSDMYLPAYAIERILKKCGVYGYDKLYVSSEHNESKRYGGLFRFITQDYHVEPRNVTHFGDDYYSDYLVPRKLGFHAVLLHRGARESAIVGSFRHAIVRIERSRFYRHPTKYDEMIDLTVGIEERGRQIGYSILGPLLVQFCRWLHACTISKGSDEIVFIARDGYIIKKCYELLYPDDNSTYLLISRRSSTVPMLWKNARIADLKSTLGLGRELSIGELMMRLGLTMDESAGYLSKHGLSVGDRVETNKLALDRQFREFYEDIKPLIVKNSQTEYAAMSQYFENLTEGCRSLALVDLGWRGTIQRSLEVLFESCNIGTEVHGFYLGVSPCSPWNGKQSMEGFLFSRGHHENQARQENWFNALIEAMFVAPHPTAKRFIFDRNGTPTIELASDDASENLVEFQQIQEGAVEFVKNFVDDSLGEYLVLTEYDAIGRLFRLGLLPSLRDATYLGDCVYAYQETVPLAKPNHRLPFYFAHPKVLIKELGICYWKPAFLKRLLRFPIPYYRFLSKVKDSFALKAEGGSPC